ncbi:hypothetical protein AVEN_162178-1 [Araneus ventricosus]|uniref:Uncharacterized protein n=1 Tax=Araneus ventricosus TaxID=182803 RepID=A0A4Y2GW45_ARAVE|nr:hypothetical protein AVEN_162178-1 [Araneus ventricosus]
MSPRLDDSLMVEKRVLQGVECRSIQVGPLPLAIISELYNRILENAIIFSISLLGAEIRFLQRFPGVTVKTYKYRYDLRERPWRITLSWSCELSAIENATLESIAVCYALDQKCCYCYC